MKDSQYSKLIVILLNVIIEFVFWNLSSVYLNSYPKITKNNARRVSFKINDNVGSFYSLMIVIFKLKYIIYFHFFGT